MFLDTYLKICFRYWMIYPLFLLHAATIVACGFIYLRGSEEALLMAVCLEVSTQCFILSALSMVYASIQRPCLNLSSVPMFVLGSLMITFLIGDRRTTWHVGTASVFFGQLCQLIGAHGHYLTLVAEHEEKQRAREARKPHVLHIAGQNFIEVDPKDLSDPLPPKR